MVTTKQIIDEAYEMGLESFPKYKNAPHLNKECRTSGRAAPSVRRTASSSSTMYESAGMK
jgi:hypothetical protein